MSDNRSGGEKQGGEYEELGADIDEPNSESLDADLIFEVVHEFLHD